MDENTKFPISKRGTFWELSNSLWIGWTFTLSYLNWIAFFYIASRSRNSKWFGWGLIYMIPFWLMMTSDKGGIGQEMGIFLTLPLGIMSIIHAFKARREYLFRLDTMEHKELEEDEKLLREIQQEFSGERKKRSRDRRAASQAESGEIPLPPIPEPGEITIVDINNASEEVIAGLPGFDPILAKKVVAIRLMTGEFRSMKDLGETLGLTEDEISDLAPRLSFRKIEAPLPPSPTDQIKF